MWSGLFIASMSYIRKHRFIALRQVNWKPQLSKGYSDGLSHRVTVLIQSDNNSYRKKNEDCVHFIQFYCLIIL